MVNKHWIDAKYICGIVIVQAVFIVLISFLIHGDLDERILKVSNELAAKPAKAELYLVRGHLYHQHEEYHKALADYLMADSLNLDSSLLDFRLAETYLKTRDYSEGRSRIEMYLTKEPKSVVGLKLRGKIAQGSDDLEQAEKDFRSVIELASNTIPQNYLDLASVLLLQSPDRTNDALKTLRQGLSDLGPIVSLQQKMLEILESQERFTEAIQLLDEMMESLSRTERLLVKKAEILILVDKPDLAKEQLEMAESSLKKLPLHIQNTVANKRLISRITTLKERL